MLALDNDGALWTWGSARDGRLGHDDYVHRFAPTCVEFFRTQSLRVTMVAAGDAHSLAVAVPGDRRPPELGEVDSEPIAEQVYTWGRGAHGRLGLSRNLNKRRPTPVVAWPPSFKGCRVRGAALGGAHSLVLAEKLIPSGLVNPWGSKRTLYAWGYVRCRAQEGARRPCTDFYGATATVETDSSASTTRQTRSNPGR